MVVLKCFSHRLRWAPQVSPVAMSIGKTLVTVILAAHLLSCLWFWVHCYDALAEVRDYETFADVLGRAPQLCSKGSGRIPLNCHP